VHAPAQPRLQADGAKMEQVLNNLVLNAIEHSKEGDTVWVSTAMTDDAWLIEVKDQGAGIGSAELSRLFAPFESGTVPKTAGERSTGLGLAIAKKIVDGHGGSISVESKPGAGTTFTVRIPITRPNQP